MINDLGAWITGQLYKNHATQQELAKELKITQQGLSYKLKTNSFSYGDMLTIFEFLKTEEEQIIQLMKV